MPRTQGLFQQYESSLFISTVFPICKFSDCHVSYSKEYVPEVMICDQAKDGFGRFMPTFPPGKIFHLKVNKSAKPW